MYETYLIHLRNLTSIKGVFRELSEIQHVADYCLEALRTYLKDWKVYQDYAGNVIAFDPNWNGTKQIFLSAHLDSVDANPSDWETTDTPFSYHETKTHITGRGVNDCRAGVAFILYVAQLLSIKKEPNRGYIFVLSFREEGNGWKTANYAASRIGRSIPAAESNYVLCLENTVQIRAPDTWFLTAYDKEPCNYFVALTDKIAHIRKFLSINPDWKPVAISAEAESWREKKSTVFSEPGGHSATIPNDRNVIYQKITNGCHDHSVMFGGDHDQISVISNRLSVSESNIDYDHTVILNNRSFLTVDEIWQQIESWNCQEMSPFRYAAGSDRSGNQLTQQIVSFAKRACKNSLGFELQKNPGRSDASAYWQSLNEAIRENFGILVLGPGTRSHTYEGIRRATHGPDESFYKPAGEKSVQCLLKLCELLSQDGGSLE